MSDEKLIIVVSQPRSGSTLLQALLSNNNNVATVSEPWLLLPFLGYSKNSINNSIYNSKLANIGINDFKSRIGTKNFDEDLRDFLLNQYSKVLSLHKERYVLDKTPRYYEILDEIVEIFPNAKIIVLKRNPFAVIASIVNTWNYDNLNQLLEHKRDILYAPLLLHNFIQKYSGSGNIMELHYEKIVNDPSNELSRIYNWLGLDYSDEILNYSDNLKFRGTMGDQVGIVKSEIPNKDSIDKWENIRENKFWNKFMMGYEDHMTSDFLNAYGDYSRGFGQKTKIFDSYLEMVNWNFNINEIPKKRLVVKFIENLFRSEKI